MLDMCGILNTMDLIYIIGIPIILFLLLKTERRSRRRLDKIVEELQETNKILTRQLADK